LTQTRWQPIFLVTGALLFVIGLTLRSSVAFVSGMLVMGSAMSGTASHSPNAAMVRTWIWLNKNRAGKP
jgi:membrane protein CcdC involved in cytochrome C biogenesis